MAKDVYAAPIVFVRAHNIVYYYYNNIDRQRAVRPMGRRPAASDTRPQEHDISSTRPLFQRSITIIIMIYYSCVYKMHM